MHAFFAVEDLKNLSCQVIQQKSPRLSENLKMETRRLWIQRKHWFVLYLNQAFMYDSIKITF